jgi:hypothetical protein
VAILRWLKKKEEEWPGGHFTLVKKKKEEWPGGPLCTGFNLITSLY